MAKVAKLLDIIKNCNELFKLPVTDAFHEIYVMNNGEQTEYYIDPRTKRNNEGLYVVKPITWNDAYFAYVCPFCQEIHIEAVNYLGEQGNISPKYALKKNQAFCRCRHMKNLKLKYVIDMDADQLWFNRIQDTSERLKQHDKVLSFVNQFEGR